jgi:SagB-type dehydrogenase family enzyme
MSEKKPIDLPPPKTEGGVSVEKALESRRTIRSHGSQPLTGQQVAQLLWSAQGVTNDRGFRTAPSAGALYPMDVYAALGPDSAPGFEAGVYHYQPDRHAVRMVRDGDVRQELARAALSQMWMAQAPLQLVITAEYSRATSKYGQRGIRYAVIEAGHIGQNVFLQVQGLGLAAGIVGAFRDQEVVEVLGIPSSHEPMLIMPVGHGG